LLGIEVPANPTRDQVYAEYELIWQNLGERSINSLGDLPVMVDPEIQAAMSVLSEIRAPANNTDINLHYLATCRMVNLSIAYGITGTSAHGYAGLATILGPVFNRYVDELETQCQKRNLSCLSSTTIRCIGRPPSL
jgi:predicted ATPase